MPTAVEYKAVLDSITASDIELIIRLGLPNKVIAIQINSTETAIRMKVTRIAAKLRVENRTAIVIQALILGIVTIQQLKYRNYWKFNG